MMAESPDQVLLQNEQELPLIPACEHVAGQERFIRKSLQLQAEKGPVFDLTCDLEDGAPAGREIEHLQTVIGVLKEHQPAKPRVGLRIHDADNPHWRTEVQSAFSELGDLLRYVTVPKVTTPERLMPVIDLIQTEAAHRGIAAPPVHLMVETHEALRDIGRLAALDAVECLSFGIMDFVSAHAGAIPASAMKSPGQFEHRLIVRAKTEICAAALANGKIPCHNVTVDFASAEQTQSDALRARREFGFMRMWSIHPSQINAVMQGMAPDHSELEAAEQILIAAQAANWAPVKYRNQLHDRASYRYFWDLLKRARLNGATISTAAEKALFSGADGEQTSL